MTDKVQDPMRTGDHKIRHEIGRYGEQQRYSPTPIGEERQMRTDRPLPPLVQLTDGGVAHKTDSWKETVCGVHIGDIDAARWISAGGRVDERICGNCTRAAERRAKEERQAAASQEQEAPEVEVEEQEEISADQAEEQDAAEPEAAEDEEPAGELSSEDPDPELPDELNPDLDEPVEDDLPF